MHRPVPVAAALLLLAAAASAASGVPAWEGETVLASAAPDGTAPAKGAWFGAVDASGRVVAMETLAPELVPPHLPDSRGVAIHEAGRGARPVLVEWEGKPLAGWWGVLALSPDAERLYLHWEADTASPVESRAFVHDLRTGRTEAWSPEHGGRVLEPRMVGGISSDGRTIAFLATEDGAPRGYAWQAGAVRDLGEAYGVDVSADGRWAATGSLEEVRFHDLREGSVAVLFTHAAEEGGPGSGYEPALNVALSQDGGLVAYEARAGGRNHIFVLDRATGERTQVPAPTASERAARLQRLAGFSDEGQAVLFMAFGDHGDGRSTRWAVYAHDRSANATRLVDAAAPALLGRCVEAVGDAPSRDLVCNGWSSVAGLSADGSTVAFSSELPDLHASGSAGPQVYVRTLKKSEGAAETRAAPSGSLAPLAVLLALAAWRTGRSRNS